jgi:hypothetical protein
MWACLRAFRRGCSRPTTCPPPLCTWCCREGSRVRDTTVLLRSPSAPASAHHTHTHTHARTHTRTHTRQVSRRSMRTLDYSRYHTQRVATQSVSTCTCTSTLSHLTPPASRQRPLPTQHADTAPVSAYASMRSSMRCLRFVKSLVFVRYSIFLAHTPLLPRQPPKALYHHRPHTLVA